ncbi:hypothetical protein B277_15964 [Janibacter hoylei PVAS-1]|nr:hypothetical protein [Janibacter hoylei]EKA59863.1 hypothetical protein B277_15964 [Janibacter hoylei PVAS-1]
MSMPYAALHVTVTGGVVGTFLHLIFERYRVQDEVLEGLVPEALKPRPVRPDVRTFLGALGLPVTVLGVSAAVASTPEAVLPQPVPILVILAGAIAMVVGLVDLFLDRVPAYFRREGLLVSVEPNVEGLTDEGDGDSIDGDPSSDKT